MKCWALPYALASSLDQRNTTHTVWFGRSPDGNHSYLSPTVCFFKSKMERTRSGGAARYHNCYLTPRTCKVTAHTYLSKSRNFSSKNMRKKLIMVGISPLKTPSRKPLRTGFEELLLAQSKNPTNTKFQLNLLTYLLNATKSQLNLSLLNQRKSKKAQLKLLLSKTLLQVTLLL